MLDLDEKVFRGFQSICVYSILYYYQMQDICDMTYVCGHTHTYIYVDSRPGAMDPPSSVLQLEVRGELSVRYPLDGLWHCWRQ